MVWGVPFVILPGTYLCTLRQIIIFMGPHFFLPLFFIMKFIFFVLSVFTVCSLSLFRSCIILLLLKLLYTSCLAFLMPSFIKCSVIDWSLCSWKTCWVSTVSIYHHDSISNFLGWIWYIQLNTGTKALDRLEWRWMLITGIHKPSTSLSHERPQLNSFPSSQPIENSWTVSELHAERAFAKILVSQGKFCMSCDI